MPRLTFSPKIPSPSVAEWVAEYVKQFNAKPSNAAGEMYDTLYLMRECIRSHRRDRKRCQR